MKEQRISDGLCMLEWLAEQGEGVRKSVAEIAQATGVSKRVAEGIFADLAKGGVIDATHGRPGGQMIIGAPEQYDYLRLALIINRGPFPPIPCADKPQQRCKRCKAKGACHLAGAFQAGHAVTMQLLAQRRLGGGVRLPRVA